MEDPEAYLWAITAPLDRAREGSPYPVARLSVEAVTNAFVVLGLLPAARAEEILDARRPGLEAAGFRVGREIGELSVNPGARSFKEERAAVLDSPRQIPLAVAAGPVRCRLRRHDLAITWATLTPEGIRLRYYGDAREGDRDLAGELAREIIEDITELSVTDNTGGTYRVPAANVLPCDGSSCPPDRGRHPFGSKSRRPPRCRRVPPSRRGRPRRSGRWSTSPAADPDSCSTAPVR